MVIGLLLMAAALFLTCYNQWDARRAGLASLEVTQTLETLISSGQQPSDTEQDMPVIEIEGNFYIGVLEIPSLELSLPVMADWDYEKMKIAPCHYYGSYYTDNLVIAGHNYISHFGPLKRTDLGREVYFTNVEGKVYRYIVDNVEILQPKQIGDMITGEWDLTLFTCTTDGASRCTVRCIRVTDE